MEPITLSYIYTTRNKLPYVRETLPDLIAAKKAGEEILVADGASSDGTPEYLAGLFARKEIDYFVSEPDKGEAHGLNKLLARAQGALIKIITDDDAFCFPDIARCKEFMLAHPDVDLLATEGAKRRNNPTYPFMPMMYRGHFEEWQRTHTPFASCGLGYMLRRSSLPLLGYFNTEFVRVDAEYSLRVTAGKARIAWYTGECFVHILNQRSNSLTQERRMVAEMEQLEALYLGRPMRNSVQKWLRDSMRPVKQWLTRRRRGMSDTPESHIVFEEWRTMYHSSKSYLQENIRGNTGEFLY